MSQKLSRIVFIFCLACTILQTNSLLVAETNTARPTRIIIYGANQSKELEEVPGSLSVIQADELQKYGVDSFQNQILSVPNLNAAGGSNSLRFLQIRGIGELEQYEGAPNNSVGLIVDDVDLTGVAAGLNLFDTSQVEVHRGPQAVRFGSNAMAGVLHLTTTKPSSVYNGQTQLGLGNDQLRQGGLAFGSKINDQLNFRLSGFSNQQNGFRNNEFLRNDETNQRQNYLGRLQLDYTPNNTSNFLINLVNTKVNNGYDAFSINNGFTTQSDRPGEDSELLQLASIKANFEISKKAKLTSISSYYQSSQDYSFDGDWGNNPFWSPYDPYDYFSDSDRKRSALAQQLRLNSKFKLGNTSFDWLNGIYYQNLNEETVISEFSNNQKFDFLDSKYEANTYAAFSNLSFPINRKLSFSLGNRYEFRDTRYEDSRTLEFQPSDLMWGGNLSLQYKANDTQDWYILLARGFKGGGFNASPSLTQNFRDYQPESLVNFEIGNHSKFLNNTLKTSVNAFLNFRADQQVKLGLQVDPSDPLSFTYLTDNAAKGRSYGLEIEADYIATKKLSLSFNGALLQTEITESNQFLSTLRGREQSHAPNWQHSLASKYMLRNNLAFEAIVQGRDSFFFDDSHDQKSSAYHLLHSNISYYFNQWELRIWARNLLDKRYATRGFYFGNEPPDFKETTYVQLGDPRTFGLTAIYRF